MTTKKPDVIDSLHGQIDAQDKEIDNLLVQVAELTKERDAARTDRADLVQQRVHAAKAELIQLGREGSLIADAHVAESRMHGMQDLLEAMSHRLIEAENGEHRAWKTGAIAGYLERGLGEELNDILEGNPHPKPKKD